MSLTGAPGERLSHMRGLSLPWGSLMPASSYGTSAHCTEDCLAFCLGLAGSWSAKSSSLRSATRTSSDFPENLSVILSSCGVCCRLMMTEPKHGGVFVFIPEGQSARICNGRNQKQKVTQMALALSQVNPSAGDSKVVVSNK